jgi:hypothetical protein
MIEERLSVQEELINFRIVKIQGINVDRIFASETFSTDKYMPPGRSGN